MEGYQLTLLNRERLFGDSGLSYAYVTMAVPAGCLFLSLAIIAKGVEAWRRQRGPSPLIFTRSEDPGETHQAR